MRPARALDSPDSYRHSPSLRLPQSNKRIVCQSWRIGLDEYAVHFPINGMRRSDRSSCDRCGFNEDHPSILIESG